MDTSIPLVVLTIGFCFGMLVSSLQIPNSEVDLKLKNDGFYTDADGNKYIKVEDDPA